MDWKFWRWTEQRRIAAGEREMEDQAEWINGMIARGWHHWMYHSPPPALIELTRREWQSVHVMNANDVRPETNIHGLWWREARGPTLDGGTIIEAGALTARQSPT